MTNLFRFLLVRAPQDIPTDEVDVITPLKEPTAKGGPLDLPSEGLARGLNAKLLDGATAGKIHAALPHHVNKERLAADNVAVGDALIRAKLFQRLPPGYEADDLLELRSRYDVVLRALGADESTVIRRRPAAIVQDLFPGRRRPTVGGAPDTGANPAPPEGSEQELRDLEAALTLLATLGPDGVKLPPARVGDAAPPTIAAEFTLEQPVLDALPDSLSDHVAFATLADGGVPLELLYERLLERRRLLALKPRLNPRAVQLGDAVRPLLGFLGG